MNPHDLMVVSKSEYNRLKELVNKGYIYAQEKDNQIEYLQDELNQTQAELTKYKTFFKNFKNLVDNHQNLWYTI